MATWTGWENQLLNAAGIIVTPPNRQLLDLWAKNALTSCRNNPIDLSHNVSGSTQCGALPGIFAHARNYTTHAKAASAFDQEIHASFAAQLLKAMDTGNPFQVKYASDVASVFVSWGTDKMLNAYLNAAGAGGGGGGGGGGGIAPRTHKAWGDLQRSVNTHLPAAINHAAKVNAATLQKLRHVHRVHP